MSLDLRALNASSAKVAAFYVRVCEPAIISYSYSKKNMPEQHGQRFKCILVGEKPDSYCEGSVMGYPRKLEEAKAKFQPGLVFKLSKIKLDPKSNATYLSTDIKRRILLDSTVCTLVLQGDAAAKRLPREAVPGKRIHEIQDFDGYARFDIMGVLRSVGDPQQRTTPSGQKNIIEVELVDVAATGGTSELSLIHI